MTDDRDISSLAAGIILQTLRPIVLEHYDIVASGVSLNAPDVDKP